MRRVAGIALAAVVLAACSGSGGRSLDVNGILTASPSRATGTPASGASGSTDSTNLQSAPSGAAPSGQRTAVTSVGAGPAATRGGTVASGSSALARGVKADRIILGWEGLADSTQAATQAVGVKASETSEADQRAQVQAMVDDLNKRGGIGGKRVEMIFHFVDVTQGTAETRGQQSCEFFTADHEIFALVMEANHNQAMSRCMAQRKTPVIDVSSTVLPVDQKDLDEHAPYLYLPLHVNVSRLGATVDAMAQQGFLDKDAKVGLLRYDYPTHVRARDQAIVPALARHGVRLTDDFAFTPVREVSDLGAAGSQAANAVLRFKAEGINRVLFLPSGWVILTVFPPAAESQGYRPRYGVDSWESPQYLVNNAPAAQLQGAVGLGWLPKDDLDPTAAIAALRTLPNWGHCAAAVRAAGYSETWAAYCTPFLFLQEAIARGTGLTPAGLRAGADKLGDAPYSTANFGTFFGPGRYDGASLGRNIAYDGGCGCFKYVSAPYRIP